MPAAKPTPGTLRETLHLENLMGSTWRDFLLLPGDTSNHHQGRFQHAYWRKAFEIGELCKMFYTVQQVESYRHEVERLRKEADAANLRADQAEEKTAFYRRELKTASRLGLMFTDPRIWGRPNSRVTSRHLLKN